MKAIMYIIVVLVVFGILIFMLSSDMSITGMNRYNIWEEYS